MQAPLSLKRAISRSRSCCRGMMRTAVLRWVHGATSGAPDRPIAPLWGSPLVVPSRSLIRERRIVPLLVGCYAGVVHTTELLVRWRKNGKVVVGLRNCCRDRERSRKSCCRDRIAVVVGLLDARLPQERTVYLCEQPRSRARTGNVMVEREEDAPESLTQF